MKKISFHLCFLCVFFGSTIFPVFAEIVPSHDAHDFQNYKNYLDGAKAYCDNPARLWGKNNSVRPIPQYPELKTDAINMQAEQTRNKQNISEEEKQRLQQELDMNRLGNFTGFKTLEVARTQYRSTMDSLFSCTIIDSRLRILDDVRSKIESATNGANSEIQNQLDREKSRLEREKNNLECNNAGANKTAVLEEIINSATRQYCHYRYYLSYLDTNFMLDRSAIERIEKNVWTGSGTHMVGTTDEWVQSHNNYSRALDREIARADATLPRAIRTLIDMEKAYPTHLLLAIIYDDYIRLRNNLATYMNASTQTYLKAYNAQDANNR